MFVLLCVHLGPNFSIKLTDSFDSDSSLESDYFKTIIVVLYLEKLNKITKLQNSDSKCSCAFWEKLFYQPDSGLNKWVNHFYRKIGPGSHFQKVLDIFGKIAFTAINFSLAWVSNFLRANSVYIVKFPCPYNRKIMYENWIIAYPLISVKAITLYKL